MPLLGHLRGASKEELVQLLKHLCSKHPEIRDDVRLLLPAPPAPKYNVDLLLPVFWEPGAPVVPADGRAAASCAL